MLLLNIDYIPGGQEFEALGIAKGTVVQSKNFGKDFMAYSSVQSSALLAWIAFVTMTNAVNTTSTTSSVFSLDNVIHPAFFLFYNKNISLI